MEDGAWIVMGTSGLMLLGYMHTPTYESTHVHSTDTFISGFTLVSPFF